MLKISIVTICYNSAKTIEDTIKSVLNQNYNNIEYIVIDGGSNDGTQKIINSYISQISYFVSEPDGGLYDAMNKGLKKCTGDVVGFINSDDFLSDKNVINEIARCFANFDTNIVYGDTRFVSREDKTKTTRYWKAGKYSEKKFKLGWMPPHLSTYIKKSLYDKHGYFRSDLNIAADYELLLRFIVKNKNSPFYLQKEIAVMRDGGISNSSLSNRFNSLIQVYKSWKINDLKVNPFIIVMKPLSKVSQFFIKN